MTLPLFAPTFAPQQTVGRIDDTGFRGVFYGQATAQTDGSLGPLAVVYVSEPGETQLKRGAVVMVPFVKLAAVKAGR